MEARIHQNHVELWYCGERVEVMPRLYGKDKELIDFRHVIDSLIRKPGAFQNDKYQHHLYPTTRFRMAYDTLLKNTTQASAIKQCLKILHAAKHEGRETVDDILRWFRWSRLPLHVTQQFELLRSGSLLDRQDNLLLFGKLGSGKTNLLSALGVNWFVMVGRCTSRRARCWCRSCCERNATCG
jgi:hypothetical protein